MLRKLFTINELFILGIGLLVFGLVLLIYSISSYSDMKQLSSKVNFDLVELDTSMTPSDKYYKYLEYSEYLIKMLEKNKGLLIKNSSCGYLDYAHHSSLELSNLVEKKFSADSMKRTIVTTNLRSVLTLMEDYKTCPHSAEYKKDIELVLDNLIANQKSMSSASERMKYFMGEKSNTSVSNGETGQVNASLSVVNSDQSQKNVSTAPVSSEVVNTLTSEQIESINSRQAVKQQLSGSQ